MAKKTRKQKQRAARRPASSAPSRPQAQAALPQELWPVAGSGGQVESESLPVEAATPARRRIERVTPAPVAQRARPGRTPANAAAMFQPLESDDAAIPFARVPYVPADLRRVAVMAVAMIALIVVAALIVSRVVS